MIHFSNWINILKVLFFTLGEEMNYHLKLNHIGQCLDPG